MLSTHLTRRYSRSLFLLFSCLALPVGVTSWAQDAATTAEQTSGAAASKGIPLSQITVEAEKSRERVSLLQTVARSDPAIQALERKFQQEEPQIRAELELAEQRLDEGLSFRDFEDMSKRWGREKDRLNRSLEATQKRAAKLDEAFEQLQQLRRSWNLTNPEGQAALQEVVDEVLELVQTADAELGEARSRLSRVRAPMRELRTRVEALLDRIEQEHLSRSLQITKADSPRLWEHSAWREGFAGVREHIAQSAHYMELDLREFLIENEEQLLQHALMILLLMAALWVMGKRLSRSELDEELLARHSRVLANPIATALALGLVFMRPLYPKAPSVVIDIVVVLGYLPFLRILPQEVLRQTKGFLLSVWLLFILGRMGALLPTDSLFLRVLLLVQCLLGLLTFTRAGKRLSKSPPTSTHLANQVANIMVRTSIVVLTVAPFANVFGYLGLTRILTSTGVDGAYAMILIFGLGSALRGLIELLPGAPIMQRLHMIQHHAPMIQKRSITLLRWFLMLWLIRIYVELLGLDQLLADLVGSILGATAHFGELPISLGGILAFFVTIYAASLISRFLRFVLEEDVYYRLYLPRGVPNAISTSLHYVLLLMGFILAVAATGVELSRLTLLLGAFGVGIGFGLQDIVRNFVSGAVLLLERPIMPGDAIQTPELWGTVKRIGIRSSLIRTWEGAEVIVPNADLVMHQVTNWTLSDRQRRMEIEVGVAYGTDPAAVVELLVEVAKANQEVLETPQPHALFLGFGESSLNFALRAWTVQFDDYLRIKSDLTIAVNDALVEAGFTIPFPQRDLHLRSVDADLRVDASREGSSRPESE